MLLKVTAASIPTLLLLPTKVILPLLRGAAISQLPPVLLPPFLLLLGASILPLLLLGASILPLLLLQPGASILPLLLPLRPGTSVLPLLLLRRRGAFNPLPLKIPTNGEGVRIRQRCCNR